MQKDNEQNEPYNVSISDWISILQDKTSANTNLYIFLASAIIVMIIGMSPSLRDYVSSYLVSGILLLTLFSLYVIYRLMSNKLKRENERFIKLYDRIILGEIIDPKKIRDEYKNILNESKNGEKI